jgi:phage portal protein BeeE
MSWLTPVIREVQADQHTVTHKLKFFENNASVNLAVVAKDNLDSAQFNDWVDSMERAHGGVRNAYKTLYLSSGADVTPVGSTMQQMDFANTQGAGEVRIANAAGIHPVVIGLVTSLGGSSLNVGNYNAAKRVTVDRDVQAAVAERLRVAAGDPQVSRRRPDATLDRHRRHRVPAGRRVRPGCNPREGSADDSHPRRRRVGARVGEGRGDRGRLGSPPTHGSHERPAGSAR